MSKIQWSKLILLLSLIFGSINSYSQMEWGLDLLNQGKAGVALLERDSCPKEDLFEGLLYNSLTHSTSLKNLVKILKAKAIKPFNQIKDETIERAVDFANPSVVYGQLLPDWMIRPQISPYADVPNEAVITFSLDYLKSRDDWKISSDWYYGDLGVAFGPENEKGIRKILEEKNKKAMNSYNYLMNEHKQDSESVIREIRGTALHNLFSHLLQNEVLFTKAIELEKIPFMVYFPSKKIVLEFLKENADILAAWDVEPGALPDRGVFIQFQPKAP